jgi:N-acetylmuramoyl-L-alanine amidase/Peptidase_C39 like family
MDSPYTNKVMLVPDTYVFLGTKPDYAIVLHKTASPGMDTAEAIAKYFQSGSDNREVSAHYVVGKDGTIVQCVREADGSGANSAQPKELGRNPLFVDDINWNLKTISIEHVDDSPNNTEPLTTAQQTASFKLVQDIAIRKKIPVSHIVQHHDLQPISKPLCAGNYPMEALQRFLQGKNEPMSVKLNGNNEVVDIATLSQFLPGKTEFACGFVAAGLLWGAGEPGKGPTKSVGDIDSWWEAQYIREYGSDGANDIGGVSIDDMHRVLVNALPNSGTSHYFDLPISATSSQVSDIANVEGALKSGYPVVVTVSEVSIYDTKLGRNPYWWGASGNHVITITGIDSDGNFLAHDPANVVGALQGANTPQPQPRHYDKNRIDISWASMARMSWLEPFPVGWNAVNSAPLNQIVEVPAKVVEPVVQDDKNAMVIDIWNSSGLRPVPSRDTVFFSVWRSRLLNQHDIGTVRSAEYAIAHDENGDEAVAQNFDGGILIMKKKDGSYKWL